MKNPLVWFYCLSIPSAIARTAAFGVLFLILRRRLRKMRFWRLITAVLFLGWLAVIAIATLADRTPGTIAADPIYIPFHSYRALFAGESTEILRGTLINVLLFFPAGLLAWDLFPETWNPHKKLLCSTAVFALLSFTIELCQYLFALGQAEADDVLHNTLGALSGSLTAVLSLRRHPGSAAAGTSRKGWRGLRRRR